MSSLIRTAGILGLTLASFCSGAQMRDFVPGYYLTQRGDTLKGYISLGNARAPSSFRFCKQLNDSEVSVVPYDSCRALTSGKTTLLNSWVKRSMTYIDPMDFTIKLADSSITASVPMRLVYKGDPFSLYTYHDVRDHFFIHDGASVQELIVTYRYLTDWEKRNYIHRQLPAFLIDPVFRQQIVALMNSQLTRKQMLLVEKTEYNERSLMKLFEALDRSPH